MEIVVIGLQLQVDVNAKSGASFAIKDKVTTKTSITFKEDDHGWSLTYKY